MKLDFVLPSIELVPSYLDFFAEMRATGEVIWERCLVSADESHAQFIARLKKARHSPEEGLVPETTYWAVINGEIVGRISLRHELNENLKNFGGNIGYEVKPSARRKGIATKMLRFILQIEKCKEIGRLLLTCAPTNSASIKTIEKNGGVLEKIAYVSKIQRDTCYYWIGLSRK